MKFINVYKRMKLKNDDKHMKPNNMKFVIINT